MTARDLMQTEVVTVASTMPLAEVRRLLSEHQITGAPVTDHAGHIVGVVSLRDLIEHDSEEPRPGVDRDRTFFARPRDDALDRRGDPRYRVPAAAEDVSGEDVEDDDRPAPRGAHPAEVQPDDARYDTLRSDRDTAADVMSPRVHAVPADATIAEAARLMLDRRIHRVLVTDGGRHVGLISSSDLLRALASVRSSA